ncbi:MAG: DUF4838 domain-containing protein [Armatimonadetes bacterium]|nr:DUF4838 domain-containing protein [Armatimonadota bacterium]
MHVALIGVLLGLLAAPGFAAGFPVLEAGQQAVIVYEAEAETESAKAYQDLASYLKRSTGKEFKTVAEGDYRPGDGLPIYVGRCRATEEALRGDLAGLDRDAYIVAVEPTRVMLVGSRPWSTYWAVCQFLEDYVGVRWLIPGPLGEDVPQHSTLAVPVGKKSYTPALTSRLWSGAHHAGDWNLRQRIRSRDQFHHNLIRIFTPEKYWDTHPEYFPLHGNQRYRPGKDDHSWQPCMGIEGTVQAAADAAREAFRKDPALESFSFGMNDGQGWCECPACKAIDRPLPEWHGFSGDKSVLYYTWLNKVAENLEKDYPDKKLGCLAYSSVILPPPFKLHRNIVPYFTSNRADYFDRRFRQRDQELFARWSRCATQMGIYDYAYGVGFAIPRIYNHLFQDSVKFAYAHNVRGFYAEVYPNWGLDGPKLYAMARIVWDPNVDLDALMRDWNERMFREAAEPMRRYFALAEETWRKQRGAGAWAYRLAADPAQFRIFSPRVMERMTAYLDEAERLAVDETVRKRIQFFRKTWNLTRLLCGNYWAGERVQRLIDRKAPVERVAAAMREMAGQLATIDVDRWMKENHISDDPIAFFPPLSGWFEPLKAGSTTNAVRYFASVLINDAMAEARRSGTPDAAALRDAIARRVDEVFGDGGSESYREAVARIRDMSLKVGTVAKLDAPVKVDGLLDEAVWQKADVLTDFLKWGDTSRAEHVTKVRLARQGDQLYVGLESFQDTSALVCQAAPRDGSAWKDDSVEIFINKGMDAAPHAQFIINAAGAFFDQYDRDGRQSYAERLAVDFDCDWAAKVFPDKWTAEVRIPLRALGIDPDRQPLVRMNFVRNVQLREGKGSAISAWFSSVRAHADPLSRGWIVLQ